MPPSDPNSIDINLSLFPAESRTVLKSLTDQLTQLSTQLQAIKFDIPTRQAAALLGRQGQPMAHGTSGGPSGLDVQQQTAQQTVAQQTVSQARPSASEPTPPARVDANRAREALQNLNMRQTAKYTLTGRLPKEYRDLEDAAQRLTEEATPGKSGVRRGAERLAQATAPGTGGPEPSQRRRPTASRNVSTPDDAGEGGFVDGGTPVDGEGVRAAWQQHFTQEELSGRFQMPRIGEFTVQDSLQMMARFLGRRAQEASNRAGGDPGAGYWRGTMGAGLNRMANTMPFVANAFRNVRPLGSMAEAFHPMQLQELGQYMRGDKAITMHIPGAPDGFRMRDPIRDTAASMWEGAKLQARFSEAGAKSAYLSMERSRDIGGALVAGGFDPDTAVDAISQYFAPARGETLNLIPVEQQVELFTQALRAGGTSMEEFVPALSGLADGARSARMSVQEFAQSANEYANTIQEQGGTFLGGLQSASAFSAATGFAPQADLQARSNPLIQGMLYQQTGLLPQLQGMLPPGTTARTTAQTIRMLARSIRPGQQDTVLNVDGGRMVFSAKDKSEALAGQILGYNREQTQRYLRQERFNNRQGRAQNTVSAYIQDIERARSRHPNDRAAFLHDVDKIDAGHGRSGVGIDDIKLSLKNAGFDDPDKIIGKNRGKGIEEAVNNAMSKRWEKIYGKNKDGTTDNLRKVQIEIAPGIARKLLRVAGETEGDKTMDNRAKAKATDRTGVLRGAIGAGFEALGF